MLGNHIAAKHVEKTRIVSVAVTLKSILSFGRVYFVTTDSIWRPAAIFTKRSWRVFYKHCPTHFSSYKHIFSYKFPNFFFYFKMLKTIFSIFSCIRYKNTGRKEKKKKLMLSRNIFTRNIYVGITYIILHCFPMEKINEFEWRFIRNYRYSKNKIKSADGIPPPEN